MIEHGEHDAHLFVDRGDTKHGDPLTVVHQAFGRKVEEELSAGFGGSYAHRLAEIGFAVISVERQFQLQKLDRQ
ncbi:hypothetical protein JNB88_19525 [Rhizobium cauense]|uniref:PHP-associated domain-containing protein n=1 Tax=Rhizobium cauense TaxID=1166683 RepID=UPI003B8389FD|nr:hypothetical protein [Rhizobium cauense]